MNDTPGMVMKLMSIEQNCLDKKHYFYDRNMAKCIVFFNSISQLGFQCFSTGILIDFVIVCIQAFQINSSPVPRKRIVVTPGSRQKKFRQPLLLGCCSIGGNGYEPFVFPSVMAR